MKTNQGIETVDEFTRTTESIREFRKYVNRIQSGWYGCI